MLQSAPPHLRHFIVHLENTMWCTSTPKDRRSLHGCRRCLGKELLLPSMALITGFVQGAIENVIMMVPFTSMVIWTFQEKVGSSWKKILWYSGKIAFIFSISIEMLQLFLRLGTFQLSDLFYNTVGGVVGGLVYYGIVKARKHL